MQPQYTELLGSARLAYAEALDNALAQELDFSAGEGFGFVLKKVTRGSHWYLQHTLGGKKKQYYFGPDTDEIRARIEEQKGRWEEGRIHEAAMERIVAMAVAAGCAPLDHRSYKVLKAASEAGLFRAGGVLVGSHAFVATGNMLNVSWVADTTVTQDIDLAAYDQAMIAVPEEVKPLGEALLDSGTGLLSVPMLNPKNPSTSFKVRGRDFRVDILTPAHGRGEGTKYVPKIKSHAQQMRFLDFILEDTQKSVLLGKGGVLVNVPSPARFALHKLVVSQRRPATKAAKAQKDRVQAEQLIACLLEQRPGDLWLAMDAVREYPSQKFRDQLRAGLKQIDPELGERLLGEF